MNNLMRSQRYDEMITELQSKIDQNDTTDDIDYFQQMVVK